LQENASKNRSKTGSGAFDDGFLPVLQYGALLCALKIPIDYAQTLPFREHATFVVIGHLHPEYRLVRENQPIRTSTFEKILCGIELLRTLNSFNPAQSPELIFFQTFGRQSTNGITAPPDST